MNQGDKVDTDIGEDLNFQGSLSINNETISKRHREDVI